MDQQESVVESYGGRSTKRTKHKKPKKQEEAPLSSSHPTRTASEASKAASRRSNRLGNPKSEPSSRSPSAVSPATSAITPSRASKVRSTCSSFLLACFCFHSLLPHPPPTIARPPESTVLLLFVFVCFSLFAAFVTFNAATQSGGGGGGRQHGPVSKEERKKQLQEIVAQRAAIAEKLAVAQRVAQERKQLLLQSFGQMGSAVNALPVLSAVCCLLSALTMWR